MRPRTLEEIAGQEYLARADGLLARLLAANRYGRLVFYGPPVCGKTSFAEVIARVTGSRFVRINAVMSNVGELREILATARRRPSAPNLLLIDALHRFNESQQDLLLPDVEEGHVRLLGATTHNAGFIARRLVILASEDVGLAGALALMLAVAAHQAAELVGLPEADYALAHANLHIACAPKSNSVTLALMAAKKALAEQPVQAVPLPLRDKGGRASKALGHGKGYLFAHDFPENVAPQAYLEKPLTLLTTTTAGIEAKLAERLARWRAMREQSLREART